MKNILELFWLCLYYIEDFVSFYLCICFVKVLHHYLFRIVSLCYFTGNSQEIQRPPCISMLPCCKSSAFSNYSFLDNFFLECLVSSFIQNFLQLYCIVWRKNNFFFRQTASHSRIQTI